MRFGLEEHIVDSIISVFEEHSKVDKAYVFGSRAKGNYRPDSDIDIAIKGQELTTDDIISMAVAFEAEGITYKIDLIDYNNIKEPELKAHIDRVGIEFYSKWKEYKLGEVSKFINGRAYKATEFKDFGTPIVRIQNLTGTGNIVYSDLTLAEDKYIENGDLIYAWSATFGPYIWKGPKSIYHYHIWKIICDERYIDKYFYYYHLLNVSDKLKESGNGTLFIHITKELMESFTIKLPPLKEQKCISSQLKTLDDKIDLLKRQNKTLEQLAETLFRQWFIEEADESWEEVSLYDCIELVGGGTPKTENHSFWIGEIPWLSGGDIAASHKTFITRSEKCISEDGLNNSSTKLLPKFATVITARGTVGKYCILSKPMTFSQSNYGIVPKIDNCYFFTYLLIAHSVDELLTAAYGSVFDTITTKTFKEQKVQLPNTEQIIKFEEEVVVYFKKILNNQIQIDELSKLRNVLLPKLMSGEVRVKMPEL